MYTFKNLDGLAKEYWNRTSECRKQQEKFRRIVIDFNALKKDDNSTFAEDLRSTVRLLGGIESVRRMREEQGTAAVAWETAADMLDDYIAAQEDTVTHKAYLDDDGTVMVGSCPTCGAKGPCWT